MGEFNDGTSADQPAIARHWNGTAWLRVATEHKKPLVTLAPDGKPYALINTLGAVECVSASDCWSVGYYAQGPIYQTFVEHWNGNAWSVVPSPNHDPATDDFDYLADVRCTSSDSCWATGGYTVAGPTVNGRTPIEIHPLVMHWDGSAWRIVEIPVLNNYLAAFRGVECLSATDCWLVGSYYPQGFSFGDYVSSEQYAAVEHWDGSAWSIVETPALTNKHGLGYVHCISSTRCWAVGNQELDSVPHALIEVWDGTNWSVMPTPKILDSTGSTARNYIYDISCISRFECQTVGLRYDDLGNHLTLIERYTETVLPNTSPVAYAGPDFRAQQGQSVEWTGTASDADPGDTLSYSWRQIVEEGDPRVTLSNANTLTPSFTAPAVEGDTSLTFELTVIDSAGARSIDTIAITVTAADSVGSGAPEPQIGNNYLGGGSMDPLSLWLLFALRRVWRRRSVTR